MVMRLLRFNLANGGVSLAGGAALMALLVDAFGVHYLVANLVTVVACGVVNYLASDRWVFTGPDCLDESGSNQIT
jgi:putative flippase GtrA